MKKVFAAWKDETKSFKMLNRLVDEMYKLKEAERAGEMFRTWRDHVHESQVEKRNEQLAMTFYLKQLMKKILSEWNLFATMKVLRRLEGTKKLEEFATIRSKLISKEFFTVWSKKTNEQLEFKAKAKRADGYFIKKLNRKTILVWRDHVRFAKHKKMLARKADSFLEIRIKTEFYFKWCIKYQMEYELQEKNERALLLWSINIQKTCFKAWFGLHQVKRQKKLRYRKALEARQVDILKDCARSFLKYSTDARQRRVLSNFNLKQNVFFDSAHLEAKYFYLWTSKCRFKHRNNQTEVTTASHIPTTSNRRTVRVETSLERREKITGCPMIIQNSDNTEFPSRFRPAPRKPNFLIDSIDVKTTKQQSQFLKVEFSEQQMHKKEVVHQKIEFKNNPTILLPPSAFSLPPPNNLFNTRIEGGSNLLISASDTTLTKNKSAVGFHVVGDFASIQVETHQYGFSSNSILNEPKSGNVVNASKFASVSNLQQPLESSRSENSKLRQNDSASNVAIKSDIELVEIKKRLETLSIKSNKLK